MEPAFDAFFFIPHTHWEYLGGDVRAQLLAP